MGGAATLVVIVTDALGGLRGLERLIYDSRAAVCQFSTPPPSDRVVHVDMDDAALETIGRWPWPRARLADIVDEVRLAGADALSLDILFPEPQGVEYQRLAEIVPTTNPSISGETPSPESATTRPAAGAGPVSTGQTTLAPAGSQFAVVDHDAILAEAIRRNGKVMVGVSLDTAPPEPPSTIRLAALEVLSTDLELTRDELAARMPEKDRRTLSADDHFFARQAALSRRIEAELERGPISADALRLRLLPRMGSRNDDSSLARQFYETYHRVRALRSVNRFAHDVPLGSPPLLRPVRSIAIPIPTMAEAAWVSGYVDYMPVDLSYSDGVLRSEPLCMNFNGRLYPQMDLAIVCAVLGTDVRNVRISEDQLVIPAGGDRQIVVPIRTVRSSKYGPIGAVFDIPWFGGSSWANMYDYPAYERSRQHVPAAELWGLAETRRQVTSNRVLAMDAIRLFAESGVDAAKAFVKDPPAADDLDGWITKVTPIIPDAENLTREMEKVPPSEWSESERRTVFSARAMGDALTVSKNVKAKAAVLRQLLAGKVVLFGGTATSLGDVKPTSLHAECPGVVVHGVIVNALLSGHFWRHAPSWVTHLITLAMGMLVTAAVVRMSPFAAASTAGVLTGGYTLVNGLILFDRWDLIVGVAGPLVAAAFVWGSQTLIRYIAEATERRRITKQFQGYVDPALVNYLIAHPDIDLEGEVREMSVVFTDLAGYTSMTEKLGARAVKILGRYKTLMVPAIRANRGLIHSFMGDGIMISYGAPIPNPNHAADALATILDIQKVMTQFNAEMAAEGHATLVTRAGVCTGPAVVGNSGSDQGRDYACLGNTTNLAARLESANKAVGTVMMISERTAEMLEGRFLLRPIAKLTVKGKTVPEMTFEPLALAAEATDEHRRLATLTTAMFDAYVAGRFADCVAAADAMDTAVGPSKLTGLYRETAQEYLAAGGPPADFQGQIVLKEK